ncbi:centromere-associated protein E-like [Talpa occidentalis]|uniref:centromere-associated protein E-like n=1 Tax=Talpa occidentalis TaxID=50954 RepID=UPI0023F6C53A|nr:centromere-associated protein E-like [Talpa occidentalis]
MESQETIDAETLSEETDQEAGSPGDLDAGLQGRTQERQPGEGAAVSEAQATECEVERLTQQRETQTSTLEDTEMEKLHEHLEEMKSVCKERDDLQSLQEILRAERDQLQESLREAVCRVGLPNPEGETAQLGKPGEGLTRTFQALHMDPESAIAAVCPAASAPLCRAVWKGLCHSELQ